MVQLYTHGGAKRGGSCARTNWNTPVGERVYYTTYSTHEKIGVGLVLIPNVAVQIQHIKRGIILERREGTICIIYDTIFF
jgi:hypothetical protein